MKAAKVARAVKQSAPYGGDASRPALLGVVLCLTATTGIVWLTSGCGLSPCGAHGMCDGVFAATCICLDGYLGSSCQYGTHYKVEGCHVRSRCGTFNQTSYTCDRAPVYQLGDTDGPVLYRHTGRTTDWAVGPSERKRDCAAIPALSSITTGGGASLVYARSYWHDSSRVEATEEPPSSPHFDGSFGGWRDFEAPHGSQLGAVQVLEG